MKRFVQFVQFVQFVLVFALALAVSLPAAAQAPVSGNGSILGFGEFDSGPGIIPAQLFGLHFSLTRGNFGGFGYTGIPWPGVTFGSLRLWDTNTNWTLMNPSAGVYSFTSLDSYLAAAKTNSLSDVVLTLSGTPAFISRDPSNTSCDYGSASGLVFYGLTPNYANGSCGAPTDVNTDGTGTDQTWRDFIYHLGLHIQGLNPATYATVNWFEIWNEFTRGSAANCGGPASPTSWEGTCAQLVRMAQDADCILTGRGTITATGQPCTAANMIEPGVNLLPNAGVLTPDAVPQQPDIISMGTYLGTAGALNFVNEIAVHAYSFSGLGTTMPDSSAAFSNTGSSLPAMWAGLQAVSPAAAFNIPVWSTEGSWGPSPSSSGTIGYLPDPDMQMGYIARYFLVGWSSGFQRLYWYSANNSYGRLFYQDGESKTSPDSPYGASGTCAVVNGCAVLNHSSVPITNAWTATYTWMVGNEMTTGCAPDASANIWTCGLTLGGTTPAQAVWDSSQTCTSGTCTTSTFTVPSASWAHYRTLDDDPALHAVTGTYPTATVAIGWKPILLVP